MIVQEALNNITIVVSNTRMTGPEHDALKQNIVFITQRCKLADELEKKIAEIKKEKDAETPS